MISLVETIRTTEPGRKQALKQELEALKPGSLPLHSFTSQGGMVDDSDISVTVLSVVENNNALKAKVGVFFTEVVGGCNCHDDPARENAYAEFYLAIDRQTAEAHVVKD